MADALEEASGLAYGRLAVGVERAGRVEREHADSQTVGAGGQLLDVGAHRRWGDDHVAETGTLCDIEQGGGVANRAGDDVLH